MEWARKNDFSHFLACVPPPSYMEDRRAHCDFVVMSVQCRRRERNGHRQDRELVSSLSISSGLTAAAFHTTGTGTDMNGADAVQVLRLPRSRPVRLHQCAGR